MNRIVILVSLLVSLVSLGVCAEPLTHKTAPQLSDRELGHLRNFVSLARQDLDDFSGWEGKNQKEMEAYRYQIAFTTYALSLQQYLSVPAYRDLYSDTINRLIERMIEKPVWEFWEDVSKGSKMFNPDLKEPLPSTKDPVGKKNIMYSGHLLHMIALYEVLYRDMKWSEPKALTFRWDSDLAFEYDYAELIDIVHEEMIAPRLEGGLDAGAMECEPNLVFPECNQHPTLAFQLFDYLRETDYAERTKPVFKTFFEKTAMHNNKTQHTEMFYMIAQDRTAYMPARGSASADGWTGAFMHVWQPDYIESLYEKQRDDYISRDIETGKIVLAPDPARDLSVAFFAILAMEVGDTDTAKTLFTYAEKHYASETDENGFRYLRDMADPDNPTNNTTDKLMGLARSNRPNGLWRLHNEPWAEADMSYPLLAKVDFPNVLVRQAVWDSDYKTLLFTLESLEGGKTRTTFRIENIQAEMNSTLERDGKLIPDAITKIGPEAIEVTAELDGPTRFTLRIKYPIE